MNATASIDLVERIRSGSPMVDSKTVAAALGVSDKTVQRMMNQGKLNGIKVGRQYRFSRDSLLKILDCTETPSNG